MQNADAWLSRRFLVLHCQHPERWTRLSFPSKEHIYQTHSVNLRLQEIQTEREASAESRVLYARGAVDCGFRRDSTLSLFRSVYTYTHTAELHNCVFARASSLHIPNLICYYDLGCRLMMLHSPVVPGQELRMRNHKQQLVEYKFKKKIGISERLEREPGVRGQRRHGAAGVQCHLEGSPRGGGGSRSLGLGCLVLTRRPRCCTTELLRPLTPRHDFER